MAVNPDSLASTSTSPDSITIAGFSTTSSAELAITSWTPLGHGGHSFVFLVDIAGEKEVIKIFRFPPIDRTVAASSRPSPYLYFRREASCYKLLARLATPPVPRCRGYLTISADLEAELEEMQLLKGLHARVHRKFRRSNAKEMPLVGLWLEYIPGTRLSREVLSESIVDSMMAGLKLIHQAGIVHKDIKWRNIIVAEDGTVKWIDFSNSLTKDEVDEPTWSELLEEETRQMHKMINWLVPGWNTSENDGPL